MSAPLDVKTVAVRDDGCYSVLLWQGRPFAVSVERTLDDGLPVIDNGVYPCKRSHYFKGNYPTFEIYVPGHHRILFHKGNVETESEACIIVGESFGVLNGTTAVLDSKGGFNEFMQLAEGLDSFEMKVTGR